jgi:hypothetical protein
MMKIKLIVTQNKGGKFPNIIFVATPVETLAEAKKIDKECIDAKTHSQIRALELNKKFLMASSRFRKKYQIPETGYSFEEWSRIKQERKGEPSFSKWRAKVESECMREIPKVVNIHPILISSLPDIVISNSVFLPLPKIFVQSPYSSVPHYSITPIKIVINSRISKNQLLKFVEEHWPEIKKGLEKTSGTEFYISERDFRIIKLKDEGKSFKAIADKLAREVDDIEASINEDSVKTAYHRAKKQIDSLSK